MRRQRAAQPSPGERGPLDDRSARAAAILSWSKVTLHGEQRSRFYLRPRAQAFWLLSRRARPQARLRLFCFPYAGKGALGIPQAGGGAAR